MIDDPRLIHTRANLEALARKLGVRDSWHEPAEQDVSASVTGLTLDNAGLYTEKIVNIKQHGRIVGRVNLATLLAWATGYEGEG